MGGGEKGRLLGISFKRRHVWAAPFSGYSVEKKKTCATFFLDLSKDMFGGYQFIFVLLLDCEGMAASAEAMASSVSASRLSRPASSVGWMPSSAAQKAV